MGTVHCEECEVCIEGYDHHCPWTSKCIGKKNLTYFYIWIFSSLFSIVYFGLVTAYFVPSYLLDDEELCTGNSTQCTGTTRSGINGHTAIHGHAHRHDHIGINRTRIHRHPHAGRSGIRGRYLLPDTQDYVSLIFSVISKYTKAYIS